MRFDRVRHEPSIEHPPPAAHGADCAVGQDSTNADEERVAPARVLIGKADAPRQFAAADHLAGALDEREENSPLLCAQMPEGVVDI